MADHVLFTVTFWKVQGLELWIKFQFMQQDVACWIRRCFRSKGVDDYQKKKEINYELISALTAHHGFTINSRNFFKKIHWVVIWPLIQKALFKHKWKIDQTSATPILGYWI